MATSAARNQELSPDSLMLMIRTLRSFCEAQEAEIRSKTGLSEPQYSMVRRVPAAGEVRTGDLCRDAGLSPSRGGRVVDELVQAGFVRRADGPGDRRVQMLSLTPQGRAVRRRIDALIVRCDEVLWQRLSATELERVLGGLKALVRAIEVE